MGICKLCNSPVKARGLCKKHYCQANHRGDFETKKISRGMSITEKLDFRSEFVTESGCKIWTGACNRFGHGHIVIQGKQYMTHRLAFEIACGEIPEGLFICHRCDVPSCINPSHLFIGTHQANMDDMKAKGRSPETRGEKNTRSNLTDDDIRSIRQDRRKPRFIAAQYGITRGHVWDIKKRNVWKHVD